MAHQTVDQPNPTTPRDSYSISSLGASPATAKAASPLGPVVPAPQLPELSICAHITAAHPAIRDRAAAGLEGTRLFGTSTFVARWKSDVPVRAGLGIRD